MTNTTTKTIKTHKNIIGRGSLISNFTLLLLLSVKLDHKHDGGFFPTRDMTSTDRPTDRQKRTKKKSEIDRSIK